MRKIIDSLSIVEGNISCKDKSGKYVSVLKTQGDLDGACATYCVIMNLLLLKVIFDSDTRIGSKPKDKNTNTLIKTFFREYGMHHSGQTYYKIKKMLLSSFGNVVNCVHYVPSNETVTLDIIRRNIDEEKPVVASVYFSYSGHALLVVGYESENEQMTRLLCLDPDSPKVHNKRWNATIELFAIRNTIYKHLYSDCHVSLGDILIITEL